MGGRVAGKVAFSNGNYQSGGKLFECFIHYEIIRKKGLFSSDIEHKRLHKLITDTINRKKYHHR